MQLTGGYNTEENAYSILQPPLNAYGCSRRGGASWTPPTLSNIYFKHACPLEKQGWISQKKTQKDLMKMFTVTKRQIQRFVFVSKQTLEVWCGVMHIWLLSLSTVFLRFHPHCCLNFYLLTLQDLTVHVPFRQISQAYANTLWTSLIYFPLPLLHTSSCSASSLFP